MCIFKGETLLSCHISEFRQKNIIDDKKRLLIFEHYNKKDLLSDFVFFIIKEMNCIFTKIVFVSNSVINTENLKKLEFYCDKIMIRKDVGLDFGAYKDVILDEGFDEISKYDSLTLINDSCFGPLQDMTKIYHKMELELIDFWGLTNHKATKIGMPGVINKPIPEHLQGYFLVFNNNVLISNVFKKFWKEMPIYMDRNTIIKNCEVALTPLLSNEGFKYMSLIDCKNYENYDCSDIFTYCPELLLIQKGLPFFKIKGFKRHKNPKYLLELIKNLSTYNIELIKNLFNETESSAFNIKLNNWNIDINNNINFSREFNTLYKQIFDLEGKIVVYGNGTIGKTIQTLIPDKIIGYVDMADNFYHPKNLLNMQFDKIIISVLGREEEIVKYLTDKLKVDKNKIITFEL